MFVNIVLTRPSLLPVGQVPPAVFSVGHVEVSHGKAHASQSLEQAVHSLANSSHPDPYCPRDPLTTSCTSRHPSPEQSANIRLGHIDKTHSFLGVH